jgi:hypothetical protein
MEENTESKSVLDDMRIDGIMVKEIEDHICLRRLEVIEALECGLFDNKKPIILFVGKRQALLTAIYVCDYCERIHLVGGWVDGDKSDKPLSGIGDIEVYADVSQQVDKFISVEDAVIALKQIEVNEDIIFCLDDSGWHSLTGIYKCVNTECGSPHFERGYSDDFFFITHDTTQDEFEYKKDVLIQEEKIAENDDKIMFHVLENLTKDMDVNQIMEAIAEKYAADYDEMEGYIPEYEKRGLFNLCEAITKLKEQRNNG